MKSSFIMYTNWMPMIASLPDSTAAQIFKAIAAYQMGEEYAIEDASASAIFQMIKATFDADEAKYNETCERRAEAGRKGAEVTNRQKSANAETKSAKVGKSRQVPKSSRQKSANADDMDMEIDMDMEMDKAVGGSERSASPPADCEAIPLNDGTEWRPTVEELAEYVRLYPGVDVRQQLAKMRGWCLGNETKRKTKRGVKAFVTTWLSKEQDRGKAPPGRKPNGFTDFKQRDQDYEGIGRALAIKDIEIPEDFVSKINF